MTAGTKERILDAALAMFAARGVAATPITAIEAAAGLSAGSGGFYRHFRDKKALLIAVVQREMDRVAKPERPVDLAGDHALTAQLRGDLEFLGKLRPLIAILLWERGMNPDVSKGVQVSMLDRGIDIGVADLLATTSSKAVLDDPEAAAAVMTSAMVGYFLSVEFFGAPPSGIDSDRFTRTLSNMLREP